MDSNSPPSLDSGCGEFVFLALFEFDEEVPGRLRATRFASS